MVNYIYQLVAFVASVVMFVRGDITSMAIWLAASVLFGLNATLGELIFKKFKSYMEVKNG